MKTSLAFDFETFAADRRALVEAALDEILVKSYPERLFEAMRYSVLAGGKRIRGLLCLASAEAASSRPGKSGDQAVALKLACAIEMVHAMSLIHDDLPCMDNDDFRRGRPTNHKMYGEAMALLAGDALLAMASEVVLSDESIPLDRRARLALELARAIGPGGMVAGQVADMESEGKHGLTGEDLRRVHSRKTGALLAYSTWSGACAAGASEAVLRALRDFGELLGLAFQIADDLLDVTGDLGTIGKTPGKDAASGKLTWVSLYGIEKTRQELNELKEKGETLLADAGLANPQVLSALLSYAVTRTN